MNDYIINNFYSL